MVAAVTLDDAVRPRLDDVVRVVHQPLIRALSLAAGSNEVAADCVQDAYLRAYLHWSRVGSDDDPAMWIRRVAWNRLRDHLRHRRRAARADELLVVAERHRRVNAGPDVDLADAVARLPLRQRSVVAMFYVGGYTIAEIAHVLRVSEGTVKSQLHDARRNLHTHLAVED
jgi:RNA polymerase sigma-70 factor, ECF subfamily